MGAAATRTPDAVIEVSGLSREFTVAGRGLRRERRTVTAVRDLSFAIERGEMVGYIGPNGAGKSTTIKMLTGILVPTDGDITVAGLVWRSGVRHYQGTGS